MATVLLGALAGCQGSGNLAGGGSAPPLGQFTAQGGSGVAGSENYRLGVSDVVDITVFNVPELNRSAQVNGDGTIMLALIGPVQALRRTPREVESEIAGKLKARFLQSPQVSIFVREYNSQRFTIEGAVTKPGIYPLANGQTTLIRAIAAAGGLEKTADASNVVVFRTSNGQRMAARFDYSSLRAGQAQDPELKTGDVIIVDSSVFKDTLRDVLQILPVAGLFLAVL